MRTSLTIPAPQKALLDHLTSGPFEGHVFTKAELIEAGHGRTTRALDTLASRLRRTLLETGDDRDVVNVWGIGYKVERAS